MRTLYPPRRDRWSYEPKWIALAGRAAHRLSKYAVVTFMLYVAVLVIHAVLIAHRKF